MPAHPLPAACRLPLLLLQLTAHQLAAQRERELAELEKQAAQRALEGKRAVDEEEYAAALAVQNKNRCGLGLSLGLGLSWGWGQGAGGRGQRAQEARPCALQRWASGCQQLGLLAGCLGTLTLTAATAPAIGAGRREWWRRARWMQLWRRSPWIALQQIATQRSERSSSNSPCLYCKRRSRSRFSTAGGENLDC